MLARARTRAWRAGGLARERAHWTAQRSGPRHGKRAPTPALPTRAWPACLPACLGAPPSARPGKRGGGWDADSSRKRAGWLAGWPGACCVACAAPPAAASMGCCALHQVDMAGGHQFTDHHHRYQSSPYRRCRDEAETPQETETSYEAKTSFHLPSVVWCDICCPSFYLYALRQSPVIALASRSTLP